MAANIGSETFVILDISGRCLYADRLRNSSSNEEPDMDTANTADGAPMTDEGTPMMNEYAAILIGAGLSNEETAPVVRKAVEQVAAQCPDLRITYVHNTADELNVVVPDYALVDEMMGSLTDEQMDKVSGGLFEIIGLIAACVGVFSAIGTAVGVAAGTTASAVVGGVIVGTAVGVGVGAAVGVGVGIEAGVFAGSNTYTGGPVGGSGPSNVGLPG